MALSNVEVQITALESFLCFWNFSKLSVKAFLIRKLMRTTGGFFSFTRLSLHRCFFSFDSLIRHIHQFYHWSPFTVNDRYWVSIVFIVRIYFYEIDWNIECLATMCIRCFDRRRKYRMSQMSRRICPPHAYATLNIHVNDGKYVRIDFVQNSIRHCHSTILLISCSHMSRTALIRLCLWLGNDSTHAAPDVQQCKFESIFK